MSSRYVFKTSSRHVFKTSWRPTNVCWVLFKFSFYLSVLPFLLTNNKEQISREMFNVLFAKIYLIIIRKIWLLFHILFLESPIRSIFEGAVALIWAKLEPVKSRLFIRAEQAEEHLSKPKRYCEVVSSSRLQEFKRLKVSWKLCLNLFSRKQIKQVLVWMTIWHQESCVWRMLGKQVQNQSPRRVLRKSCSENMQQMYRRTPMSKCDFNKVAKQKHLWWDKRDFLNY